MHEDGGHSFLTGSNIATGCDASFPASGVERLVPIGTGRSVWLGEADLSPEVGTGAFQSIHRVYHGLLANGDFSSHVGPLNIFCQRKSERSVSVQYLILEYNGLVHQAMLEEAQRGGF